MPAGLAILRNDCLGCHTEDLAAQQRLTEAQWTKVIDKMHKWGSPTEPENIAALTTYLAATYGKNAEPFVPGTLLLEGAAAAFDSLPDGPFANGDRQRGHGLYEDRCEPCHEKEGRGGTDGITLHGRHVLQRAAEFASVVRSGRGRMPGADDATDAEIADILAFLRADVP